MEAPTKGSITHQGQRILITTVQKMAVRGLHGFGRQCSHQKRKTPNFDLKLSRTLSFSMEENSRFVQASFDSEPAKLLAATLQSH